MARRGRAGVSGERKHGWYEVWARRALDPQLGSTLAQLLAADGYDTPFTQVDERAWLASVDEWTEVLGIDARSTIFEVGCGAGAFLYGLARLGCSVGGIDQSPALIEIARGALPGGEFAVGDAADTPVSPRSDFVLACSVFEYFSSEQYVRAVVERMAARATKGIAILALRDAELREAAIAERTASAGGEQAYRQRYEGLEHRYYSRAWIAGVLEDCGLSEVTVAESGHPLHLGPPPRFSVYGRKS
jgi:SAM-dependent methyltransferase